MSSSKDWTRVKLEETRLEADYTSTIFLVFIVLQSIFLPEIDAERSWENPICLEGLGPGLQAEEILAPPGADTLISDLLGCLSTGSAAGDVRESL